MATKLPVDLDDHDTEFIRDQIQSGQYDSASEVVHEGLRLLEDRQRRLEVLRAALDEGEASGEAKRLDIEAFIAARRADWQR